MLGAFLMIQFALVRTMQAVKGLSFLILSLYKNKTRGGKYEYTNKNFNHTGSKA